MVVVRSHGSRRNTPPTLNGGALPVCPGASSPVVLAGPNGSAWRVGPGYGPGLAPPRRSVSPIGLGSGADRREAWLNFSVQIWEPSSERLRVRDRNCEIVIIIKVPN